MKKAVNFLKRVDVHVIKAVLLITAFVLQKDYAGAYEEFSNLIIATVAGSYIIKDKTQDDKN